MDNRKPRNMANSSSKGASLCCTDSVKETGILSNPRRASLGKCGVNKVWDRHIICHIIIHMGFHQSFSFPPHLPHVILTLAFQDTSPFHVACMHAWLIFPSKWHAMHAWLCSTWTRLHLQGAWQGFPCACLKFKLHSSTFYVHASFSMSTHLSKIAWWPFQ